MPETTITLPTEIVRRILNAALHNLTRMKKEEGSLFPRIDQRTIDAIIHLQTRDTNLI